MKLFLETAPTFFVEEDKIITSLFEEGLDCLLLKKPASAPVYYERLLSLIPQQYYKRILTADYYYLTSEFRIQGIHVEGEKSSVPDTYKGAKSHGCSTAQELAAGRKRFNYQLFGPLPHDPQKSNAPFMQELEAARKRGLIDKRTIACGEVDLCNVEYIKRCGFGGLSLSVKFWELFDNRCNPSYNNLIEYFCKIKKLAD